MNRQHSLKPGVFRRFFSGLGPGLIAGAADDDPSGVTTYSLAGAQHGTRIFNEYTWGGYLIEERPAIRPFQKRE